MPQRGISSGGNGGNGGGGIALTDAVDIPKHGAIADAFFHFLGGDTTPPWADQLGNLTWDTEVPGSGNVGALVDPNDNPVTYKSVSVGDSFGNQVNKGRGSAGQFDYLNPTDPGLGPFTLLACVRGSGFNWTSGRYIFKIGTSSDYGCILATTATGIRTFYNGAANDLLASSNVTADESWHHVAFVIDGTAGQSDWTNKLYIDGVQEGGELTGLAEYAVQHQNLEFFLGQWPSYYFNGGYARSIVGVRRAMTQSEVQAANPLT